MKIIVKRKLPSNYNEQDNLFFEREFVREIDSPSSEIVEPAVITSQGIIFSGLRLVKASLVPEIPNSIGIVHLLAQRIKKKKITWNGSQTPALVFDYWYRGYFHWMTEVLPRLLYLGKVGAGFIPVLPHDEKTPFIKKTLEPFGFDNIAWIGPGEYLATKKALLVRHTAPTGNFNEALIGELRSVFRSHYLRSSTNNTDDRIYISRSRSGRRRVVNDDEVSVLLRQYGFVTLCFEDYTFEKQVQLAGNASMLVSIHGAGLTNMLFMNSGSSILEFRPRNDHTNLCYYALASALDFNYFYQFGEERDSNNDIHDDLHVDLVRLKENVERMISIR